MSFLLFTFRRQVSIILTLVHNKDSAESLTTQFEQFGCL